MAVPIVRVGGVSAIPFILKILTPPFGLFLALCLSTRSAAIRRPTPTSTGRVVGCYLGMIFGLGVSIWMSGIVLSSRSSTAGLSFLLVPVIWTVGGIALYILSWLLSLLAKGVG